MIEADGLDTKIKFKSDLAKDCRVHIFARVEIPPHTFYRRGLYCQRDAGRGDFDRGQRRDGQLREVDDINTELLALIMPLAGRR